jgi:hypothetical protein
VLQVSGEMEYQRTRDVRDPGHRLPQCAVIGVGFDLTPQGPEVTVEQGGNGWEQQAQCDAPLPARWS